MSKIGESYRNRAGLVRRIIGRYRKNSADIDELEQEVYLRAHSVEQQGELQSPERLLAKIARNLAINDAMRKSTTETISTEEIADLAVFEDSAGATPEQIVSARQRLQIVSGAIESLAPGEKEALLMRRVNGLKYKEIAAKLDITVSAVEKRIANAVLDIHIHLQKHGYDAADFPTLGKSAQGRNSQRR